MTDNTIAAIIILTVIFITVAFLIFLGYQVAVTIATISNDVAKEQRRADSADIGGER